MRAQRRNLHGTPSFNSFESNQKDDEEESNPFASSSEKEQG